MVDSLGVNFFQDETLYPLHELVYILIMPN